jgi:hypothetical protein
MIITTLAKPGTRASEGDLILAFDPQEQERLASDKRAELVDLDSQIERCAESCRGTEGPHRCWQPRTTARASGLTSDRCRVAAEKNSLALSRAEPV